MTAVSEQTPTTPEAPAVLATATRRHDPISHYSWLDFGGWAGDEVHALMKGAGWRWSGYRDQYRTNARWPRIPAGIAVEEGGTCDYSAERAERLETRASKHQAEADAAYKRSNDAVALIPMGQPILVGHHSERGHRAALKRSRAAMDKCVAEADYAKDLQQRAEASKRHQAQRETPAGMTRRRAKLAADLSSLKLAKARWTPNLEEWQRRVDVYTAEIAELDAAIHDAGGILADRLTVGVGDLIKIKGMAATVERINPKTYTVRWRDWKGTIDKTYLTGIIATAAEIAANRANQAGQAE